MVRYEGRRTPEDGAQVTRCDEETGECFPLPARLDLRDHSLTGFAWGYGGSGPAQLALALLADALGDDERATRLYQAFKWEVVASLPTAGGWALTDADVAAVAHAIEATQTSESGER